MDYDAVSHRLYERLYPVAALLCAAAGVACYAAADPGAAAQNFLAVGLGVRLDDGLRRYRFRRSEARASRGWVRTRVPV